MNYARASIVCDIVAELTGQPRDRVTPDSLLDDLDVTVIENVGITLELERVFSVSISDDAAEAAVTVRDFINGVRPA